MRTTHLLLLAVLILAAFWRIVPHPDNMTPVMAVALFAGVWLKQPLLRLLVPVSTLLLSDLVIGFHNTMLFVYIAMLVPVLIGPLLRGRSISFYAGASVLNALIFFVVTNIGVWLVSGMYSHNLAGLLNCFTLALPFLWKTMAGDLFFTVVLFALFSQAHKYSYAQTEQSTTTAL